MKISKNLRATVKFSEPDFKRIESEALTTFKSVPQLLKDAYFNRLPTTILLSAESERLALTELKRIGNNINQIAKHLNSGDAATKSEFEQVQMHLKMILNYIRGASGNS